MKCRECRKLISAYVDGELATVQMDKVRNHIECCDECRREYLAVLKIKKMCADIPEIEVPEEFRQKLHLRFKQEESRRKGETNFMKKKWIKVAIGIAAAFVIVIGVIFLLSIMPANRSQEVEDMAYQQKAQMEKEYAADVEGAALPSDSTEWGKEEALFASKAGGKTQAQFVAPKETGGDIITEDEAVKSSRLPDTDAGVNFDERKIIKSGYIAIETVEFERTVDAIIGRVKTYGGYIESSNIQGVSRREDSRKRLSERKAHFEIRIPKQHFESFISEMGKVGNVIDKQVSGKDITGQYFDTEARLKALKVQEERLLAILSKAERLQDILEVERELSRVRYEIESLTTTLKRWDRMVEYSQLSVDVYEVKEIKEPEEDDVTFGEKLIKGFINSLKQLGRMAESLAIFTISALPYLVVAAVLYLAGRKIYLSRRRKNIASSEGGNNGE